MTIHEESGYLAVTIGGDWDYRDVKKVIDEIAAEARDRGFRRVFVDGCELSKPTGNFDRFLLGRHAANVLSGISVALLGREEHINHIFENAASAWGARVLVDADRPAALKWLLEERPTSEGEHDHWLFMVADQKIRL